MSLHKWQGINLLDTVSKIMSVIVNNILQKKLTREGYDLQFGSTPGKGCPDTNLTIKSVLQLRCELDNNSWVIFFNLVKVFDTVDHKIIVSLLRKYRIPERIVRVVQKIYTDFKMELKIGKSK